MNFKINNKKYYPIKDWEHRYAISEDGSFVRIMRDHKCNVNIVREIGNNVSTNVVLIENLIGIKRQKAYHKITLAFDTFNPGERLKTGKAIKIKDGNNNNLSKSNLVLSNKNSKLINTNTRISISKLKQIAKLRKEDKSYEYIKNHLKLKCTTETIKNKLKLYLKLIS